MKIHLIDNSFYAIKNNTGVLQTTPVLFFRKT